MRLDLPSLLFLCLEFIGDTWFYWDVGWARFRCSFCGVSTINNDLAADSIKHKKDCDYLKILEAQKGLQNHLEEMLGTRA